MMEHRYISEEKICRLIKAKPSDHCMSCHTDSDEIALEEVDLGKGRWTELCCGIRIKLEEYQTRKAVSDEM